LHDALLTLGVPEEELVELQTALERDGLQTGEMGTRTRGWLGRLGEMTGRGALAVAPEASGGVIAALILKYLGMV
jgi:hypothetical protein